MDVTRAEFDALEHRVSGHDEAIMTLQRGFRGVIDDLYGDPSLRSGPVSLFERLDRMEAANAARFDELARLIQVHDAQIQQWLGWQHMAGQLVAGVFNWTIQGRLKRALGWLVAVGGGAALGGVLFAIVVALR